VGSSCSNAGIKVTDDQDAQFNAKRLPAGDYDTALFAWVGTPFKSGTVPLYKTKGSSNFNNYANASVDKLFAQALVETDTTKRNDLYNQADAAMAKDFQSLPLYQVSNMLAQTNSLSPKMTYNGPLGGAFWDAYEWVLHS
jgi:peptide/nickel transport system substrate-binding protein